MKILVPYFGNEDFDLATTTIHVGGIEKFIKCLYDNIPNIKLVKMDHALKGKALREHITSLVAIENPDCFVNNYNKSMIIDNEYRCPVLHVNHYTIGGFDALSFVRYINKPNMLFVSSHQFEGWNKLSKRVNGYDLEFTRNIISPEFAIDRYEDTSKEYDLVTVGRCSKTTKDPFMVHRLASRHGLKSLVISITPKNTQMLSAKAEDGVVSYYEENKHWSGNQETIWNLPHDQIFDYIGRGKVFVSTWSNETFGITALEAASCGVPGLLYGTTHASAEIYDSSSCRLFNSKNFLEQFNELKDFTSGEELATRTYTTFSRDNFVAQLTRAINNSIDSYKASILIDNFFL